MINTINSSNNSRTTLFILATIQSSPSLTNHYLKRRSSLQFMHKTLNITDDSIKTNLSLSTNKFRNIDHSHGYHFLKDGMSK